MTSHNLYYLRIDSFSKESHMGASTYEFGEDTIQSITGQRDLEVEAGGKAVLRGRPVVNQEQADGFLLAADVQGDIACAPC